MLHRGKKLQIEVAAGKAFLECVDFPDEAAYFVEFAGKLAEGWLDGSKYQKIQPAKETATTE